MIEVITGDITDLEVQAIVCPAHKHLLRGQGVSEAIFDKAGPALVLACSEIGKCPVGEARITEGYRLPTSFILHTVTPQWSGGDQWGSSALEQLKNCYENVLKLALEHNISELVFPALGAGSNKIPHMLVAQLAFKILSAYSDQFDRIVVCLYDTAICKLWERALVDYQSSN